MFAASAFVIQCVAVCFVVCCSVLQCVAERFAMRCSVFSESQRALQFSRLFVFAASLVAGTYECM